MDSNRVQSREKLELSFRLLGKAFPPQPISLQVPGWAGEHARRVDGNTPQPAHCIPFIEGATYGIEFLYSFQTECHVTSRNGKVEFKGDFANESWSGTVWPPFQSTNPGHYSVASLVDLRVPEGFSLRIEPHPRFFNDRTTTVPAAVIGNIRTNWWPMYLFVTFRAPHESETHIFRKGEAYAQAIVVPNSAEYSLRSMSSSEAAEREVWAQQLLKKRRDSPKNQWTSSEGLRFDDLYRRLRGVAEQNGDAKVRSYGQGSDD